MTSTVPNTPMGDELPKETPRTILENVMQHTHIEQTVKSKRQKKRVELPESKATQRQSVPNSKELLNTNEKQISDTITPRTALLGLMSSDDIMQTVMHPRKRQKLSGDETVTTKIHDENVLFDVPHATTRRKTLYNLDSSQPAVDVQMFQKRLQDKLALLKAQKNSAKRTNGSHAGDVSQDNSVSVDVSIEGSKASMLENTEKHFDDADSKPHRDPFKDNEKSYAVEKSTTPKKTVSNIELCQKAVNDSSVKNDNEFMSDDGEQLDKDTTIHLPDEAPKTSSNIANQTYQDRASSHPGQELITSADNNDQMNQVHPQENVVQKEEIISTITSKSASNNSVVQPVLQNAEDLLGQNEEIYSATEEIPPPADKTDHSVQRIPHEIAEQSELLSSDGEYSTQADNNNEFVQDKVQRSVESTKVVSSVSELSVSNVEPIDQLNLSQLHEATKEETSSELNENKRKHHEKKQEFLLSNVEKVSISPSRPVVKSVPKMKKAAIQRQVRRKIDLPISTAQFTGILQHFCPTKVSKNAVTAAEDVFAKYLRNLTRDMEAACSHARRKTVSREDMELIMKRQKFITENQSLNSLIEQHLPMEYRELLIPISSSALAKRSRAKKRAPGESEKS